jgi:hypothetical protein
MILSFTQGKPEMNALTQNIFTWLFAMMTSMSPVNKQTQETQIEATARYESIIKDTVEIAFDESQKPLFDGDNGRIKTAATMIGIDYFESNYSKDVDVGSLRGDHNRSWCIAQINLNGGRIKVNDDGSFKYFFGNETEGWSGRDLVNDRKKCFKAQLAILRASFKCDNSENYKLNAYASGKCNLGGEASFNRMTLARKFWSQTELKDDETFVFLKEEKEHLSMLEN